MRLLNRIKRSTVGRFLYMNKMLLKYRHFIANGAYCIMPNLRTYYRLGNYVEGFPSFTLSKKLKLIYNIEKILPTLIISKSKRFNGTSIYFSNMPDITWADAKIFDYKSERVLTICPTQKRFETIIQNKELSAKYFPTTKVLKKDLDNYIYEEPFVKHTIVDDKNILLILQRVLDFYCDFYSENLVKKEKTFIQHGDLSIDNVILNSDNDLYFIDFDHMENLPIFYDLFYLLTNIALTKETDKYINQLFTFENQEKLKCIIKLSQYETLNDAFADFKTAFSNRWMKNMPQNIVERYKKIFAHIDNAI